ncbi:NAD-dependent epimerase/dehydratase family protein [Actinomycetes bacterium KLBMP 9797]
MKTLVIGATGYIGSRAAAALAAAGHDIAALRRPGGRPIPTGYGTVAGDLLDPPSLTAAASGFDLVVHAAAPLGDADLPGAGALIASGSPLLYTTGAAVLGSGQSDEDTPPDPHPLAAARPEIERRVLAAGGRVIRPGMVYGTPDAPIPALLAAKATERGRGVYIGPRGVRWPVVHGDDLAALYVAVAERAPAGTIWHGISETARLDEVAATIGGGAAASWPLEEATKELGPLADLFTRSQDVSSAKTQARLGWHPRHTSIVATLTHLAGRTA